MLLSELVNLNLFAFLLVFARMGMAFSLMPGFGSQQVPMRARLVFALVVSFVITPVVMPLLPVAPTATSMLFLLLVSEVLIGAFLGTIPRILMGAMQTAGTLIAMLSSMANAFVNDPVANQQSSIISTFLSTTAMTLVFVTDLHHLMLGALVDSYTLFSPAQGPMIGDMTDYIAHRVADSFRLGVQITAPIIVAGVAYYLGLGIMGRLMPLLPVFFFGIPIQIMMQMYILMASLSAIMLVFLRYFENALYNFTTPLGG